MKLNPIFSSHMVFAANKPIRIYGEGAGTAEVSFAGLTGSVTSESDSWLIELPSLPVGGPYELHIRMDSEETVLTDVFVGTVILYAGQSNLQFKLSASTTPRDAWRDEPRARLFSTERVEQGEDFHPSEGWVPCRAESAGKWSAIAYHTSRMLAETRGVVGAIGCWQGASCIETWVPAGLFRQHGICLSEDELFLDHWCENFSRWNSGGYLYERQFSQVKPFSVSAVVWYQGESDQSLAEGLVYADELCLLIDQWRADFADPGLPFIVVQIAEYTPRYDDGWRAVQKAQLDVQGMRNGVKTVISADVCETDDIHPPTKDKLSRRIADALSTLV